MSYHPLYPEDAPKKNRTDDRLTKAQSETILQCLSELLGLIDQGDFKTGERDSTDMYDVGEYEAAHVIKNIIAKLRTVGIAVQMPKKPEKDSEEDFDTDELFTLYGNLSENDDDDDPDYFNPFYID